MKDWHALKDGAVCTHCNRPRTATGQDPCIAGLPGVEFACCGHGEWPGYVMFKDGRVLRGFFERLGDGWPEHTSIWDVFCPGGKDQLSMWESAMEQSE